VGVVGLLLLGAMWGLRLRHRRSTRLVLPVASVAVLLDLLLVALPSIYAPPWHTNIISRDRLATVKSDFGPAVVAELPKLPTRIAPMSYYYRYANLGHVLGFRSIIADDPLLLARTTDLLEVSQGQDPEQIKGWDLIDLERDGGAAFDILGAGVLLEPGGPFGSGLPGKIVSRPNGHPLPLLSLVPHEQTVGSAQESLAAVLAPGFDPRSTVVLEETPGFLQSRGAAQPGPTGSQLIQLVTQEPGMIQARVLAPRGGYLVFSESYYPGWQAQADGQTVPLVPADHAIMAVALSPGLHIITLRFTTPWLLPSLLLAFLGVLAIVVLVKWEGTAWLAIRQRWSLGGATGT
jgi:hypothetical protein